MEKAVDSKDNQLDFSGQQFYAGINLNHK